MPATNDKMKTIMVPTASDREIVVTRTFDAPRELVFQAATEAKHIARWWGPRGYTQDACEWDARPGGQWRIDQRSPDGSVHKFKGYFLEVVAPERIVHTQQYAEYPPAVVTITLEDQGGKTKLTTTISFETPQQREGMLGAGALWGMNESHDRLEELLALHDLGKPASRKPWMVLSRTFDAPRALVFAAFTEPAHLDKWFGPHMFTTKFYELDLRPGGAIRFEMTGPDGTVFPATGTYHEVVAPERLVYTNVLPDGQGGVLAEIRNTVTFEDVKGKTKLTIRADVVKFDPRAEFALAGMEEGWSQTLERLAEYLATTRT